MGAALLGMFAMKIESPSTNCTSGLRSNRVELALRSVCCHRNVKDIIAYPPSVGSGADSYRYIIPVWKTPPEAYGRIYALVAPASRSGA
ncbi:uncharacterized protein METZ01_LOCUS335753 [marine metagenome]|jgi:hypothetical protein|uniref:Uncharacterized protein n=1 Tax=marine metagenome TaxID=408172 RepID=A0A382QBF5_9ZZZZ